MRGILARWASAAALLGLTAAMLVGTTLVRPLPAQALGPGRVCMVKAPAGAFGAGHVGWAYRVGSTGTWVFGATERGGSGVVPPGGDTGSWSATGSFDAAKAAFRNAGHGHGANYYRQYRCRNWPTSAVGAANAAVATQAGNGYLVVTNNCLDKSIAILRAYGLNNLPDGFFWANGVPTPWFPNYYFDNLLSGFEPTQNL